MESHRENTPQGMSELHEVLMNSETRKDLVEYYKWTVNLATFVLTVSLSLAAFIKTKLDFEWFFVGGWASLAVCILLNWLLVKRLISMAVIEKTPEEQRGFMAEILRTSLTGNIKAYGCIQNWTFLIGVAAIFMGFLLNVLF